jgi:hypothetical protein
MQRTIAATAIRFGSRSLTRPLPNIASMNVLLRSTTSPSIISSSVSMSMSCGHRSMSSMSAAEAKSLYQTGEQRITPAITRLAPVVIRSGSGSWYVCSSILTHHTIRKESAYHLILNQNRITTVDGQKLLDFTSGRRHAWHARLLSLALLTFVSLNSQSDECYDPQVSVWYQQVIVILMLWHRCKNK